MKRISITTASATYTVLFARGLLSRLRAALSGVDTPTGIFILSSPPVWRHCGRRLLSGLRPHPCRVLLFDDRERSKTLRTVESLARRLVRAGADRHSLLIAVGGGVVGDVAGFVAASYLRGVALVHVPTTLVAQVDSAIGGKTGVNLPEGKNLIGAFYQPRLVAVDPDALGTLPPRQYRSGLYEVIKYGVIGDLPLYRYLENRLDALLRRDPAALDFVIPRCIAAKAAVVRRDERESGLREILNFGHTFAHALESLTHYRRFLHGEAVAWGILAETELARLNYGLGELDADRIRLLISRAGPLPALPRVSSARLLAAMRSDKKVRAGRLRFALPRRIGNVEVVPVAPALISSAWRSLPSLLP